MEFEDFFNHSFIRTESGDIKPNPISIDRYTINDKENDKPISDSIKSRQHHRVSRLKEESTGEVMKQKHSLSKPQSWATLKQKSPDYSQPLSPKVADEFPRGPSSPQSGSDSDQFDDFVMINEDAIASYVTKTSSQPTTTVSSSLSQRILGKTTRPFLNYALPEPQPVPTQKAAFEQIQRSGVSSSSSIGVIPESDSENTSTVNLGNKCVDSSNSTMMTSPPATPPQTSRFRQVTQSPPTALNLKRQDSCSSIGSTESCCSRGSRHVLVTDVSQMSPPVNFVLPSSPTGGISPISASYAMNRSRRCSIPHSPNQQQISPSFFNW